jgi:hypothetical protein
MEEVMNESRFPLCWPQGVPRTQCRSSNYTWKQDAERIRTDLLTELERLNVDDIIISTNARTNAFGTPRLDERPSDPGVAIYFTRKKKRLCFACDRWDSIRLNMKAIAMSIEAIRGLERFGAADMVERAFTGFAQLPAQTKKPWREVLQFGLSTPTRDMVEERFKNLARSRHPDAGGSHDLMSELNTARAAALQELA